MVNAQHSTDSVLISPQGITNGATVSQYQDTIGADWCTIRVAVSNIAQPTIASADGATVKITESDDTNSSNFASIASIANKTGIKNAQEVRYDIDCRTRKRYIKAAVIPGTSGATNEPCTAFAIATLSRLNQGPSGTAAMVSGTNDQVVISTT